MKKRFSLLLLLLLICLAVVGCSQDAADNSPESYIPNGNAGQSAYDTSLLPVFDVAPGVYYDALTVSLSCANPSYTIRYTTDCSLPTADSEVYTEPFPMSYDESRSADAGVVVYNLRAACFDADGKMVGRVVSASYLFPESDSRFTTKVISMVTERSNLYDSKTGIFKKPNGRGREWERPVNFQLYDLAGTLQVQQDLGVRINGTGSRGNAQKNLRLFARKDYTAEAGHLNYALFPGLLATHTATQIEEFDTFLVRGGASNFKNSMITNLIAYEMMKDSAVTCGAYEPAALYINGEYYGLMMIIEDYGPYFFESHYGVDEEKITTLNYTVLVEGGLGWELDDCSDIEASEWSKARHFVEDNDMTDPKNYKRACEIFDMQNFIEYLVFNCYVNNWDWPRNNVRVWRYYGVEADNSLTGQSGGYDPDAAIGFDGRWRFCIKDLDVSMGMNVKPSSNYWSRPDVDFFEVLYKDGRVSSAMTMFAQLIHNKQFAQDFFLYLCEFMSTEGTTENFLNTINTLALQVAEEMKYHSDEYDTTLATWDKHLQSMRDFATSRPAFVRKNLTDNKYGLPNIPKLSLMTFHIEGEGSVVYNNMTCTDGFSAYSPRGYDVMIYVDPAKGYVVDSVTVDGGTYDKDTGLLYLRSAESSVTIVFKEGSAETDDATDAAPNLIINEVGHSAIEKVNDHDWMELYNPGTEDVSLKNYTVTNGSESFTFKDIKVPAGGFKVIFFSGTEDGGVYAPFTISGGDNLALLDPEGNIVDSIALLMRGDNTHLGRYPDGGAWVELPQDKITPNAANVYDSEFKHYYDERSFNTIMVNGLLLEKSLFTVTEDGVLTTTKSALSDIEGLSSTIQKNLLKLFADLGDNDVIRVNDYLNELKDNGSVDIYYVELLNTWVIHV